MKDNGLELMTEIGKLQQDYQRLKDSRKMTKQAICDLVIPFRDKHKLSDKDALAIARNEMSLNKITDVLSEHK